MKLEPKVSIIIPVYNGSDFLSEAIDSALNQTYKNLEVIVVNDGSLDEGKTEKIALSYGDKVRYLSKVNGGVGSALNLAIKSMSGDYFSWLSHDDLYYEDKIQSQIEALNFLYDEKTILYGDYVVFSNDVNQFSERRMPIVQPHEFRYFLTVKNIAHGCTLLIPRKAFDQVGLFNEDLRTTQDYDLWFRLAEHYSFVHMSKLLVKARQHPDQGSITMSAIALKECDELLTGFVEDLTPKELAFATHESLSLTYAKISSSMEYRGFYKASRKALMLAMKNLGKASLVDALKSCYVLIQAKWIGFTIPSLRKVYIFIRAKVRNA
jgi:glycosyltransferase involved in cell wall biosynthesis